MKYIVPCYPYVFVYEYGSLLIYYEQFGGDTPITKDFVKLRNHAIKYGILQHNDMPFMPWLPF